MLVYQVWFGRHAVSRARVCFRWWVLRALAGAAPSADTDSAKATLKDKLCSQKNKYLSKQFLIHIIYFINCISFQLSLVGICNNISVSCIRYIAVLDGSHEVVGFTASPCNSTCTSKVNIIFDWVFTYYRPLLGVLYKSDMLHFQFSVSYPRLKNTLS